MHEDKGRKNLAKNLRTMQEGWVRLREGSMGYGGLTNLITTFDLYSWLAFFKTEEDQGEDKGWLQQHWPLLPALSA